MLDCAHLSLNQLHSSTNSLITFLESWGIEASLYMFHISSVAQNEVPVIQSLDYLMSGGSKN